MIITAKKAVIILLFTASVCHAQVDTKQIRYTVTHSNQRDTVCLQQYTVKEFKDELAKIETGGYDKPYQTVNRYGFIGKYQISKDYLSRFAKCEKSVFLSSPWRQERTMNRLCLFYLKEIHRLKLERYIGTRVAGITITLEGLMAGYHQHPVALVKWLKSGGKVDLKDGNKFPVSSFVKRYGY